MPTIDQMKALSDEALMCLQLTYLINSVSDLYADDDERAIRFGENARYILDELARRVPVSHLWEIEKIQRDLNLKIE